MKRLATLALGTLALAACQGDLTSPAAPNAAPNATSAMAPVAPTMSRSTSAAQEIPGRYIVMLKPGAAGNVAATAARMVAGEHGQLREVYSHAIQGFTADIADTSAIKLSRDSKVLAVVPAVAVYATTGGTETSAPWGLDRVDQTALPLSTTYTYA